ncbi:MAG: hypothetical protein ACE5JQ_00380 [Candidatus Methylomirabilales bacterium]
MTILRKLLEEQGIQPVEAGGALAPAQNAFCAKICSKIITSQFCIILLNNEVNSGREIPNANVYMEYGLMLGFNKYVIPFQRAAQRLPFNVAGLDTIKYTDQNFESLAAKAIDQAIEATRQDAGPALDLDQIVTTFLLTKKALVAPLNTEGDRNLFEIGRPLGFNLLYDFTGFVVIYFGNFTALRPETVLSRLRTLQEIIDGRRSSLTRKVQVGVTTVAEADLVNEIFRQIQAWVLVTSDQDKRTIIDALTNVPLGYQTEVFSLQDVQSELQKV